MLVRPFRYHCQREKVMTDVNTQPASTETQQRRPSRAPWILSGLFLLIIAIIAITYGYSSRPLASIAQPDGVEKTQAIESNQNQ